jgi:hypothetical protein
MKRIIDENDRIVYQHTYEHSDSPWDNFHSCRDHIMLAVVGLLGVNFYAQIIIRMIFQNPQTVIAGLNSNLDAFIPFSLIIIFLLVIVIRRIRYHRLNPDISRFELTYEIDKVQHTLTEKCVETSEGHEEEQTVYNLHELKKTHLSDTGTMLELEFTEDTIWLQNIPTEELEKFRSDIRALLRKDV